MRMSSIVDKFLPVIIAVIAPAVTAYLAYYFSRRRNDADVATTYQALASRQAKENLALEECQDKLNKRIDDMDGIIKDLSNKVDKLTEENSQLIIEISRSDDYVQELSKYIDDLLLLLKANGINPPRAKPKRKE